MHVVTQGPDMSSHSTENTGMIAGLGVAAQLVTDSVDQYSAHMKEVRDYLESQLEVRKSDVSAML